MTAAARWAEQLDRLAIPDHILRTAPEDPHHFSVDRFAALAADALRQPPTLTHAQARARLPDGGSVLDVGCGGGAASLPLAPPAGLLIGVDASDGMLAAFADAAAVRGVTARTVAGRWPQVAAAAPAADVVVCAHVFYNVADLVPFARALTGHARRRVVVELPTHHPLAWLAPYWRDLHGLDRPTGPTSDDALAVLAELGYRVHHRRWPRPNSLHGAGSDEQVAFVRARLALSPDRDADVRAAVARRGVPTGRDVVTAWWEA